MSSAGVEVGPTVTVVPERFNLVQFEAPTIGEVVVSLCRRLGLPADVAVRVEIDETTPLGKSRLVSSDPAVLAVESGALEDPHRPRHFHPQRAADVLGLLLLRLRDRVDPSFGEPASDADLSLPLLAAWDIYAAGRLARLGYPVQRQRRLYQFRVRHGFSDESDAIFAQLWEAEGLDWATIQGLSDHAAST